MSFLDLSKLEPPALVAQYVLTFKGQGSFLPYTDYEIISEWLKNASSADQLLLILDDLLPKYFSDEESRKRKCLSGLRMRVLRRIVDERMRALPVVEAISCERDESND